MIVPSIQRKTRRLAAYVLTAVLLAACLVLVRPGASYATQDRNAIQQDASPAHWTGTDALGRDRTVRTAAAMLLGLGGAVVAAAVTTAIAAGVGTLAAFSPAWLSASLLLLCDAFLILPWLFLLMMVRSGLALTTSPFKSLIVTFAVLAALGWPACARTVYHGVQRLRRAPWLLYGSACGIRPRHLARLHVLPHLWPLLKPQFLLSVPAFVIAEANLGTLGLGIAEPLPSWGGLLLELDNSALLARTHWVYLPVVILVTVLLLLEAIAGDTTVEA